MQTSRLAILSLHASLIATPPGCQLPDSPLAGGAPAALLDAAAAPGDLGAPGPGPTDAALATDLAASPAADAAPATGARHARCGWIFSGDPAALADYLAHADWFDSIHPVWWSLNADGVSLDPRPDLDDAQLVAAARAHGATVMPTVDGSVDVSWLRAMLYDPARRAAHIAALVQLATDHGYDGLDLDYEHLWDAADAAPLAAFVQAFGAAMHAAGKRAAMAVPALAAPSTVWSYADLSAALDHAHLMAYDFHTVGTHAGPTAPLGWIDAVGAQVAATGHPERFVLGLPNYGVTPASFCTLATCPAWCTTPVATSTDHMATCPFGNYAAGRSLNCQSASGTLFFDDAASLEEKVASARAHGLGGVTYWNVGGEPTGFFDMVKRHY